MVRRRGGSGATWLAVTLCALALLGLAVSAVFMVDAQRDQRAALRDRYADRVGVAQQLLDSLFRVAFLSQAGELEARFGGERASVAALDARVREGNLSWAAIVDAEGRVRGASTGTPRAALRRLGDAPYVRWAIDQGYGLGDLREGALESAIGFGGGDDRRALVSGSAPPLFRAFLQGTLEPLPGGPRADAYVLDGGGRPVAAVSGGAAGGGWSIALREALRDAPRGTFEGASGERFYAAEPIPNSRWRLVVSIDEDLLYESAGGISRWLPWIILGVGAVALVGIALLLRRLVAATAALRASNRELERSNADLEQFAYVASHDLSEPLRTVAGFSQLLGDRYRGQLDPKADLYIDHMRTGVERMQQLIDDLLVYSRVGRAPLRTERVDLADLLDEVLAAIGPTIEERGARVTSAALPVVSGSAGELRQVLQNLLVNAIKFTAHDVVPEVHVGAARAGREWRIDVRDNGIGVDTGQQESIFKMFGRLHTADAYPGTGIGLAVVKRIVERHGGRIWVEAAPGGGSVFAFTVPAAAAAPAPQPRPRDEVHA